MGTSTFQGVTLRVSAEVEETYIDVYACLFFIGVRGGWEGEVDK